MFFCKKKFMKIKELIKCIELETGEEPVFLTCGEGAWLICENAEETKNTIETITDGFNIEIENQQIIKLTKV